MASFLESILGSISSGTELVLWICALTGTLFFLIRVILLLVGGIGAEDMDMDGELSGDVHDSTHTDIAFKLVSFNSIGAFIMMFGWTGLTALVEFKLGTGLSLIIALLVGFVTMSITAYIFYWAFKLQSAGANFSIDDVVGKPAKVYQRIPEGGKGIIHVTVNGMLREIDAKSENGEAIDAFTNVQIEKVVGAGTVSVSKN